MNHSISCIWIISYHVYDINNNDINKIYQFFMIFFFLYNAISSLVTEELKHKEIEYLLMFSKLVGVRISI